MLDSWALAVSVLAFVVSGAALFVALWQLVLQADASGGRGIMFEVHRPWRYEDHRGGEVFVTYGYHVLAQLVGNDLYEVAVHLERNGRPLEFGDPGFIAAGPEKQRRMTCEQDPIVWDFTLSPEDAKDIYCVFSWVAPYAPGVRTNAFRRPLAPPHELEQWRWFRTYRLRRRLEGWVSRRCWDWVRRALSRPLRFAEWRPVQDRDLRPGQSPLHSRAD